MTRPGSGTAQRGAALRTTVPLETSGGLAFDELAVSLLADHLVVLHNRSAADKGGVREAAHLLALVG